MKTSPPFLTAYRALMDEAVQVARVHQTSGITLLDGLAAFSLSGAEQAEVDVYVSERSRVVLTLAAASFGIVIVEVPGGGKETVH